MERHELYGLWQSRGHKDRPAWVLEHADEIEEHTDTSEPIPRDSIYAVRDWLDRFKGTVTRQLSPDDAEGGTDPQNAETTTTDGAE